MNDKKVDEIVKELKELEPLIMQCSKCGHVNPYAQFMIKT